ncbi:MAG: hypothetical protein WCK41_12740, partial [Actinomycetes bacterium]
MTRQSLLVGQYDERRIVGKAYQRQFREQRSVQHGIPWTLHFHFLWGNGKDQRLAAPGSAITNVD